MQEEAAAAPSADGADDLEHWRERVFRFVLFLTVAFAFPSLAFWTYAKAEQGRLSVAVPVWALYLVFILLGAARRIDWRKRALVFLCGLFVSGALPILEYGFRSQGPLLLLAATTASSVFFGLRASVTMLVLSLLLIGASAALFLSGTLQDNASHPLTSVAAWTGLVGTFLFIGICCVAMVGVLMRRLEQSLKQTRTLNRELVREVEAVQAEKSATLRELGERRRAERSIEQRDRVLGAVGSVAERLLAGRHWEDSALEILTDLGTAAAVGRVTLGEIVQGGERGELIRVRYFKSFGEEHWAERPEARELPVAALGLDPFVARLRTSEAAVVKLAELPEAPQKLARELRMAVGLALPVSVNGELWGFLGFESADPDFELPATLTDMLRAAAGSLGAAIARDRLNAELEQRVLERTERLARANDDLKAFSFTVSHDLRAPLRQLGAFVAMLKESAGPRLDDDSSRLIESINESARRMTHMIDDLLRFHSVGWSQLSPAPVDLSGLIREVIAESGPDLAGREVAFEVAALPVVPGDRALLKHAFVNLLGNALKYSRPRPRAEIAVSGTREDESVVIAVRDNGVGFDPKYQHRLFQVFQRLHSAHEFDGSGIGLAHVKRIVERHGGRVWAESTLGVGATFYVALPDGSRAPAAAGPAASEAGAAGSVK